LEKVNLPEMWKGEWEVKHFLVDRMDWSSWQHGREVPIGQSFTKLMRGDVLVMSDTPAEQHDHRDAVDYARGSCLLNGLGLGMVLKNILLKPSVTDVTVVEISQDLIDLISPFYSDPRVTYVCCNAFDYKPPRGKRYQMVWHDIWDYISEENLPDMQTLHDKYRRRTRWQGSWCKEECER
jgi:spermidine synthase